MVLHNPLRKQADFLLTSDPFKSSHGKPHSFHADQCPHSPLLHTSIIGCLMTESSCHGLWNNPHITGDYISSPKIANKQPGALFSLPNCVVKSQLFASAWIPSREGLHLPPNEKAGKSSSSKASDQQGIACGQHVWRIQELRSLQENVISVEGSFLLVRSFEEIFSV